MAPTPSILARISRLEKEAIAIEDLVDNMCPTSGPPSPSFGASRPLSRPRSPQGLGEKRTGIKVNVVEIEGITRAEKTQRKVLWIAMMLIYPGMVAMSVVGMATSVQMDP